MRHIKKVDVQIESDAMQTLFFANREIDGKLYSTGVPDYLVFLHVGRTLVRSLYAGFVR